MVINHLKTGKWRQVSYKLGEDLRIVMLSSPEGDDKVLKYPKAFLTSDVLIISKSDLLPYLHFDQDKVVQEARSINPDIKVFFISALNGEGLEELAKFIKAKREAVVLAWDNLKEGVSYPLIW